MGPFGPICKLYAIPAGGSGRSINRKPAVRLDGRGTPHNPVARLFGFFATPAS